MRAIVFDNGLKYRSDYPEPGPREGEALIRVRMAGICNTDIELTRGYMGFSGVPGHEFVGVVASCGDDGLIGKRVVGEINLGCGACEYCRNNRRNHCPDRSVLGILNRDGVFAEYITLPVENLHQVPDSVDDEEAVFIEPLAAAFQILEQIHIAGDDRVCVLGDGKLGLLVSQVVAGTGCDLLVVGKHEERLSILSDAGTRTELLSSFGDREFDTVIECTGSSSGMETALDITRPGGNVVLKTTVAGQRRIDLNKVVINEISIIGSRCGPFQPAIDAVANGKIRLRPLISGKYDLEDGIEAFHAAVRKENIKIILTVS